MWASNESAKKAANGTHLAIRIGNLQFDEDSDETAPVELMVKGLSGVGFDAVTRSCRISELVLCRI